MSRARLRAFWSYVHDDDQDDDGAVLLLAKKFASQYALLTGGEMELFVDRTSLRWGDIWRDEIDSAISGSTYFIPILTPRFFRSSECMRELAQFGQAAATGGFDRLVLPILYVDIPEMVLSSVDTDLARFARVNYFDWQKLRLKAPTSSPYRRALKAMVSRLVDAEKDIDSAMGAGRAPGLTPSRVASTMGLAELLVEINGILPVWLDAVMANKAAVAQYRTVQETFHKRLDKVRSTGPNGAEFAVIISMVRQLIPLNTQVTTGIREYVRMTRILNEPVLALIALVEANPNHREALNPLVDAVSESLESIRQDALVNYDLTVEAVRQLSSVTREAKVLGENNKVSHELVQIGNRIVASWAVLLGLDVSDLLVDSPQLFTEASDRADQPEGRTGGS